MENRRELGTENNSRLLRQWKEDPRVFFLTNTCQSSNDIDWKMFHFSLTDMPYVITRSTGSREML